ncbi:conserved hypothetical protein [Aspergillus fumigatus A1163]|uniref:Uncharacterized protein n=1 Tax=Aspergillus fumigatus (strain CBS 144.89 / FGSC A1163 / CEA10) TaxID=451804 RepID=B0YCS6_ASPFC|nr:conserved hypothetical protein [Aspergillus fumigatus A1163]
MAPCKYASLDLITHQDHHLVPRWGAFDARRLAGLTGEKSPSSSSLPVRSITWAAERLLFDLDQLVLVLCRRSDAPSTFELVFLWTRPLPVRFNNYLFHIRRCGMDCEFAQLTGQFAMIHNWWPWNKLDTTM